MATVTVTVTVEQAQLLARATQAKEDAAQSAQMILTVLTAGHVPAGAVLTAIDAEALVFDVPDVVPDAD